MIGVNGLGRMKHCVPLSEIAICFMRDQCGDPAGDDGLMSHNKTITVSGGKTSHRSVDSSKIFASFELKVAPSEFYDTFM